LPKYNPEQRRTFSIDDWLYVCDRLSDEIDARGIPVLSSWVNEVKAKDSPCKSDQDGLDACICLLVALYLSEWKDCLMVGDLNTGYIVVPYGDTLRKELEKRCVKTNRDPSAWVRPVSPNADR
jgi:predicted RNase H-like nuclease